MLKSVTINELMYLGIADDNGVIDQEKMNVFVEEQKSKGNDIKLSSIDVLDNEMVEYNKQSFGSGNLLMD